MKYLFKPIVTILFAQVLDCQYHDGLSLLYDVERRKACTAHLVLLLIVMGWFHLNLVEYLHQRQYNQCLVNYDLKEVQALNNLNL
jgi:hypothetical protein